MKLFETEKDKNFLGQECCTYTTQEIEGATESKLSLMVKEKIAEYLTKNYPVYRRDHTIYALENGEEVIIRSNAMSKEEHEEYQRAAITGTIRDYENPIFILNGVNTDLLLRAIAGEFDLNEFAKIELKNRGINI